MTNEYLTASQAAQVLGVNLKTLYTYASRGLIHSQAMAPDRRDRTYSYQEIVGLKERSERRRKSPKALTRQPRHQAEGLVEFAHSQAGERPLLHYSGRNLLPLALDYSVEEVAALLWLQDLAAGDEIFSHPVGRVTSKLTALRGLVQDPPNVETFQMLLSVAAADDPGAYDLRPVPVAERGARILKLMLLAISGEPVEGVPLAQALQRYWAPDHEDYAALINYALISCADITVSSSILAVQCVASGRSTLYAAVVAGLSTILGLRRGRQRERIQAFMAEVGTPDRARMVLESRLKRGEDLFGFANNNYLRGDPRGSAMMNLARTALPNSRAVALSTAMSEAAMALIGETPNLDFALVTLTSAMELPNGSALTISALGHTVVWIAAAITEYQQDRILLPPL